MSLICKSKTLFESAGCGRHCGRIINRAPVAVALWATRTFRRAKRLQLFLYDLGVLDHGDAAASAILPFNVIVLPQYSAIDRSLLMFADDQYALPSLTIPAGPRS